MSESIFRRCATPQRVVDACEELGDDASSRNVRALLGGGSLRDITPIVTEWKARRSVGMAVGRRDASHFPSLPIHRRLEHLEGRLQSGIAVQKHANKALCHALHADLLGLRTEMRQLFQMSRQNWHEDEASIAPIAEYPATVHVDPLLERIYARLTAIEVAMDADSLAVAGALNTLVERLVAFSDQVQRLVDRIAAE